MSGGPKRLYRSSDQRIVLGACGGIAEYFNIDPTVVGIVPKSIDVCERERR